MITVLQGTMLGLTLWCLCYSASAAFCTTEPGISEGQRAYLGAQSLAWGMAACVFAFIYLLVGRGA